MDEPTAAPVATTEGPPVPPPVPPAPPLRPGEGSLETDFIFETESDSKPPMPPPLPRMTPLKRADYFDRLRDFFTTANIVLGIGIIILFFGVSFLLKYAVDHGLFPLEFRYIGAGLLGFVLLGLGWRLRLIRRNYALLIQGCAIGILYITVFSAARWHGLVPLPLSFALMVALVVLSGILSVLEDARGMASFAAAGGFLAPVLTSTGGGHHVLLFSYYALLSAGILGVAFFKTWRELNLIGFTFTLGIGSAWGAAYYRPELFATTEPFLILFFLLYLSVAVLFAFRQPPNLKGLVDGTLVFGLPVVAFTLQVGLVKDYDYGLAWSALALGGLYIVLTTGLWRYRPQYMRLLTEAFLALGLVFGSLTIPFALDGRWTAAAWAMEGAALLWIGVRQGRVLSRCFGLLLQIAAGVSFIAAFGGPSGKLPIVNSLFIGLFIISFGGMFSSYYLWANRERLYKWERNLHIPFLACGLLWWYVAGIREINHFVPWSYRMNASIGFFAVSAFILRFLYHRLKWLSLRYPVFCLLPVLVLLCAVEFADYFHYQPFRRFGYLAWPLALVIQYYLLWRHEDELHPVFRRIQHLAGLWLTVFLLTWETSWIAGELVHRSGAWRFIAWGVFPALAAQCLLAWGDKLAWPVKKHQEDYKGLGVLILIAGAWCWLVGGSLANSGDPWPLSYIVLFNPLELAQIFTLEVLFFWYLRFRDGRIGLPFNMPIRLPQYILAGTCFIMINGVLARAVHHWGSVPFTFEALFASMVFQAGLSIFWTVLALSIMSVAARKGVREVWFVGAALLAVVVVKLFLADLSNTGTIARIISFLVVGILMLLIGYVSPLPPRPKTVPKEVAE